jgi:hypothetical protein
MSEFCEECSDKTVVLSRRTLEVNGLDELRLLSAFQALRLWSGAYGVTHKRAREVIFKITGLMPIARRKPERPTEGDVVQGYLNWLVQNCKGA